MLDLRAFSAGVKTRGTPRKKRKTGGPPRPQKRQTTKTWSCPVEFPSDPKRIPTRHRHHGTPPFASWIQQSKLRKRFLESFWSCRAALGQEGPTRGFARRFVQAEVFSSCAALSWHIRIPLNAWLHVDSFSFMLIPGPLLPKTAQLVHMISVLD